MAGEGQKLRCLGDGRPEVDLSQSSFPFPLIFGPKIPSCALAHFFRFRAHVRTIAAIGSCAPPFYPPMCFDATRPAALLKQTK